LVDEELVGEAEIFFAKLTPARTQEVFGQSNFVFGGELQRMMNLVKAIISKKVAADAAEPKEKVQ
jgi:hypothetical protein